MCLNVLAKYSYKRKTECFGLILDTIKIKTEHKLCTSAVRAHIKTYIALTDKLFNRQTLKIFNRKYLKLLAKKN